MDELASLRRENAELKAEMEALSHVVHRLLVHGQRPSASSSEGMWVQAQLKTVGTVLACDESKVESDRMAHQWIKFPSLPVEPPSRKVRSVRLSLASVTVKDRSLPIDVLDIIGRFCGDGTLASLSRTSKGMLEWFGPILIRHVIVLPNQIDLVAKDPYRASKISCLFAHREIELASPLSLGLSLQNVRSLVLSATLLHNFDYRKQSLSTSRLGPTPSSSSSQSTLNLAELTITLDLALKERILVSSGWTTEWDTDDEEWYEDWRTYWVVFKPAVEVLDLLNPDCVRFVSIFNKEGSDSQEAGIIPEKHRIHLDAVERIQTRWTRLKTVVMDHVDLISGPIDHLKAHPGPAEDSTLSFFMRPRPSSAGPDWHAGPMGARDREWTLRVDVSACTDPKQMVAVERRLRKRDVALLQGRNMRVVVVVSSEEKKGRFEGWVDAPKWDWHRDLVTVEVAPDAARGGAYGSIAFDRGI